MAGLWVVLGVLVAGSAAGLLLRRREGRVKTTGKAPGTVPDLPAAVTGVLDPERVTLVQISTTFCAPCRHARAVLTTLADGTDGLRHVDLDVTQRPEVAQQLGVLRTPTTLALAPDGRELLRVGGVPKAGSLLDALRPHLPNAGMRPGG
ncbi:thioredoxin family protein [Amycolatopsis minnesotensis]|uniref:Thioredoxin family protein n=1 Tax=Amycolatopsis minnesotensis TaxID=337894 RepID=A0ABN2SER7_9PSEU